jgi:hypothetical protein
MRSGPRGSDDPSIQDFADQALELATLRAELKRLARDYENPATASGGPRGALDDLRRELTAARMQLREERQQQSQTFAATIVEEASRMRPLLIPVDRPDSPGCALARHRHDRPHDHERYLHPFQCSEPGSCAAAGRAGSVTLVNVSSTNGCFVNDERVTKQRLQDGDLVRIGDRSFRFACNHPGS